MARSIWTGSLSFGLVNIPVKLVTAVREERVAFHLLHDQDKVRLKQKMVCPEDGKEVHREHMVKGYEISPDRYVIVQDSELEAVAPKSSRIIEISDFVNLSDIDPVYFDRAYYLLPAEHAEKAYRLLGEAMEKTGKVGIAKFTMRSKEYLAALRPSDGVIVLETMHFSNEVTPASKLDEAPREVKVDTRELHMAEKLIEGLSTEFKPEQYHDEYRQRVLELVQKKAHGESVVSQPKQAARETRAADLMAALEASLSKARNKKNPGEKSAGAKSGDAADGGEEELPRERSPRRKRAAAHAHESVADKPARRRKSA